MKFQKKILQITQLETYGTQVSFYKYVLSSPSKQNPNCMIKSRYNFTRQFFLVNKHLKYYQHVLLKRS